MTFVKSRFFFSAHKLEANVFRQWSELCFTPYLCQGVTVGMSAKMDQDSYWGQADFKPNKREALFSVKNCPWN